MNTYRWCFTNIFEEVEIGKYESLLADVEYETDLMLNENEKYQKHANILRFKIALKNPTLFSFIVSDIKKWFII